MKDFSKLDAAILRRMHRAHTFHGIMICPIVAAEAKKLQTQPGESDRVVDRRLQALRRAGKVTWSPKPDGWRVAS